MDGKQLLMAIDHISREKGIATEKLIDAIETALGVAARKKWSEEKIQVNVDPDTGNIDIVAVRIIVDEVENPKTEIDLNHARQFNEDAEVGDEVGELIDIEEFGRIAAQVVKQVVFQKVREAEGEIIVNDFGARIGEIISGIVVGQERRSYMVDLGKTEARLPVSEQVRREKYRNGDRISVYLVGVNVAPRGVDVVVSRAHKEFVRKLFEMEVPEISEGIVEIQAVERDPGERTKIAVSSSEPSVDPVGACVGMKGSRVQAVVRELKGEKIDIISWAEDPRIFIAESLSPADVEKVGVNHDTRTAVVVVDPTQLSLAIGKRGQNVRLASRLTGWKIDVVNADDFNRSDEGVENADSMGDTVFDSRLAENITSIPWIEQEVADLLSENGIHTLQDIVATDMTDVINHPLLGSKVQEVVKLVQDIISKKG